MGILIIVPFWCVSAINTIENVVCVTSSVPRYVWKENLHTSKSFCITTAKVCGPNKCLNYISLKQ